MMKKLSELLNKTKRQRTSVTADFKDFLKHYNCKWRTQDDDENKSTRYLFDYQGGHFAADIKRNDRGVDVNFPGITDTSIDDLQLVRTLCNHFNANNTLLKFTYTTDEEQNRVSVHLSFFANTVWPEEFPDSLNACFYFQRRFCEDLRELKQAARDNDTDDAELDHHRLKRERFVIRQQEIIHQPGNPQDWRTDGDITLHLDDLLRRTLGLPHPILTSATVTAGEQVNVIEAKQLDDFNPLSTIIEGEGQDAHFVHDDATLTVRFTTGDGENLTPRIAVVAITNDGDDGTTLYARVTLTLVPQAADRDNSINGAPILPMTASVLVACDKASPQQKLSEFDYMWKDATIKRRDGEPLDELQSLIADVTDANIGYNMYWGRKLMLTERFCEALQHLENAFNALRTNYFDLSKNVREAFFEICYNIGFCYTELHLYRDAYYYLDFLHNQGNIRHTSELINALANGKDFRLFALTENIMKSIREQFDPEDDLPDELQRFDNFMRRRRAYALIDHHRLDEAEKAFTAMLDDPENSDYALGELAYIKRLRGDQDEAQQELPSNQP